MYADFGALEKRVRNSLHDTTTGRVPLSTGANLTNEIAWEFLLINYCTGGQVVMQSARLLEPSITHVYSAQRLKRNTRTVLECAG